MQRKLQQDEGLMQEINMLKNKIKFSKFQEDISNQKIVGKLLNSFLVKD